jgi:predicted lipid-binding transport protein (Tim44 family)
MKNQLSRKRLFQYLSIIAILFLVLLIVPEFVYARPGGGQSYSGGSDGGGGGGDGLASLIIYLLLSLPPEISIPLVIIIVVLYALSKRKKSANNQTIASVPTYQNRNSNTIDMDSKIESFKRSDPNFSKTLFLDFVSSTYLKYYSYYSKKEFSNLRPFLSQQIFGSAIKVQPNSRIVSENVIGNINIVSIIDNPQIVAITADISANYTMTVGGRSTRYIIKERWTFNRDRGVLSQGPEKMRDLKCPNCGAASNFSDVGQCDHCNTYIESGKMQWFVSQINILSQEVYSAQGLGVYAPEVGTDYPTIVQNSIETYINQFVNNHSIGDWNTYWNGFTDNIVSVYFKEIYKAWSDLKWEKIRQLVSDRLYDSYDFWIVMYKCQGLRNRLENISIRRIDMARVDVDKFYESFTVRVFASCLDYVETTSGQLKGGSKKNDRYYSEYWTFIRRTGVEKSESEFNLHTCPNCGAPADKIGQAGVCEYCNTKITTGDFSWVLTRIVQDEEYLG